MIWFLPIEYHYCGRRPAATFYRNCTGSPAVLSRFSIVRSSTKTVTYLTLRSTLFNESRTDRHAVASSFGTVNCSSWGSPRRFRSSKSS